MSDVVDSINANTYSTSLSDFYLAFFTFKTQLFVIKDNGVLKQASRNVASPRKITATGAEKQH